MIDGRRTFIEYFEKRYGRKPLPEDAEGESLGQIAQDLLISRRTAKYEIQRATSPEFQCTGGTDCPCPNCWERRLQDEREARVRKRLLQLLKTDGYYSDLNNFFRRRH